MGITTVLENDYILNTLAQDETVQVILDYLTDNVEDWRGRHVLWDLRDFDFGMISPKTISAFVEGASEHAHKRIGLKTGIVVTSEVGFGMMRMLQILGENRFESELGVFRNMDEAVTWIEI